MNLSRNALFGRLDTTLYGALEAAIAHARSWRNENIELAHLLRQLFSLTDTDCTRILLAAEINRDELDGEIDAALAKLPTGSNKVKDFSYYIYLSVERAWILSSLHFNDTKIRSGWFLAALLETPELREVISQIAPSLLKVNDGNHLNQLREIVAGSPESIDISFIDARNRDKSKLTRKTPTTEEIIDASALGRFCVDLTEQARDNRIDPIIGRENEIRSMIDILLRRRQNNPLLTGDAGVGKTALVEGLALAIVTGNVPPPLHNVRLLSLDVGALVAGAGVRGEFESRLKAVIKEIYASAQPVILFVDEVHTFVGSGEANHGTSGAANLLKPALARGALRLIGATTWEEYKKYIEKDAALIRRFQLLQVLEPSPQESVEILHRLLPIFSQHHQVMILDEAVQAAVNLSHRYIPTRQLPDKAISLLDTACARAAMSVHAPPVEVEFLRRKISSLKVEKDLLEDEIDLGLTTPSKVLRIIELEKHLDGDSEQLKRHENTWQKELDIVRQLQILRQNYLKTKSIDQQVKTENEIEDILENQGEKAAVVPKRSSELKSIRSEIIKCEKALQKIRGINPLIYAHVDADVVASVVGDWTGIPVGKIVGDEVKSLLKLQGQLAEKIVGQEMALEEIVLRIQTSRANLTDKDKPIGAFLLTGPAGSGKTELAYALAETLFEGRDNLITLNMSEYREAFSISALTGSPPGYIGYGEAGVLTEPVRRRPYSVVLLEDIDKAHSDVRDIFNQILDKGELENREGTLINFKNTLILMTTNLGSDKIIEMIAQSQEFPSLQNFQQSITEAVAAELPPAFLGRTVIIPFIPLAYDSLEFIARKQLEKIGKRLSDSNRVVLKYDDIVIRYIIEHCINRQTGARSLVSYIEQTLLSKVATMCLEAMQMEKQLLTIQLSKPSKSISINEVKLSPTYAK